MKKTIGELVVRPRQSPRATLIVAGLLVLTLLGAGGFIYNYGLSTAGMDRYAVARQQEEFQNEVKRIKAENQDLRDSLARAQLALQMDQTAYQELDRSLKGSSQEINKLREELSFYRNIISPPNKQAGLQIQRLDIGKAPGDNMYNYKLVLIQALKHDRPAGGQVKFEVQGEQDGKTTVLYVPDADKPIYVNFKYFQDVDGVFHFPSSFKPVRVKVTVTVAGSANGVEQTYNWPRT